MASIPVDEESMRQLAVERGAAVRDYLLAQKLPSERLFLGAVRTKAERRRLETRCRTETGDRAERQAAASR